MKKYNDEGVLSLAEVFYGGLVNTSMPHRIRKL